VHRVVGLLRHPALEPTPQVVRDVGEARVADEIGHLVRVPQQVVELLDCTAALERSVAALERLLGERRIL